MSSDPLRNLSMSKYEVVLARVFPGASGFELVNNAGAALWWSNNNDGRTSRDGNSDSLTAWKSIGKTLSRRIASDGRVAFRGELLKSDGDVYGWLIVYYDAEQSVPMHSGLSTLQRAFSELLAILCNELELQLECNQLALELTERYEELNLVYSTDDQVEYFEEGQQALVRLVHNCADYLDVGMAALICRDRNLELSDLSRNDAPENPTALMELLRTSIYDRVESQVEPIVLNELDDLARKRVFADREDNLVAQPIIDDHGTAIGILAVAARRDLHTFSNGDRNLLEVMAKKASRIIHTHHDSLTGLMNRSGFESALVSALAECRAKNREHCVLHVDIDQLHVVNDLMGHQEGDGLIRRVARVLRQNIRDSDSLARLGGDEFGVLLTKCSVNDATTIASKIGSSIRALDVISANRQLNVSASVGISPMSQDSDGIVGLLASAEIACKSAKEHGRDGVKVFERDNTTLVRRSEEVGWIGRVQQALRDDNFTLFCQPVLPLIDEQRAAHYEILIRLLDDNGDIISPAEFMPAAERYQLMPLIDRWVIRTALEQLSRVWETFLEPKPVFCINLSGQSLTNNGFLAFVLDELRESGVPPTQICFEITETAAIANIDDATEFMSVLKKQGCRFSLDDFGAGLSSFGYLKVLPVEYLKIDGSFVREMTSDRVSLSMVEAICSIGQTMGLSVVAEYVGDAETVKMLREIGVDFGQGFGLGKPEPLRNVTGRLNGAAQTASA